MSIRAIVLSQCEPQHAKQAITELTPSCTATLGRWDSLGVLEGESIASLGQEIRNRAGRATGVRRTETLPVLRETNGDKRHSQPGAPETSVKPVRAHLLLRTRPGTTRAVYDRVAALPESQDVYSVAGRYDIVATVGTQSVEEFSQLLTERVSPIEGIASLETAMIVA